MFHEEEPQTTVVEKVKVGLGNGRGTLLLAILGISVSLASSFMFCLASIGFDFTQIGHSVFWSRWASMAVTTFIAYAFVIVHVDERNRMRPWYLGQLEKISNMSAIVGKEFEAYLAELNLTRRVEWYKRHINEKIAALNKALLKAEINGKPTEEIKRKIGQYSSCLTPEYLEANKYALKTHSRPITAAQVLSETQRGDSGETNFRSATAYYGGKAIAKVLMSLIMTATFSCVVVQNFSVGVNVASVVMTILTVLSIFISVLSAITAANGCYKHVYVPNILFRLKILADFETWKRQKGK